MPIQQEITADYQEGSSQEITLHDGSKIIMHKAEKDRVVTNRLQAMMNLEKQKEEGHLLSGLLYIDPESEDLHDLLGTTKIPLNEFGAAELCPGNAVLQELNKSLR